MLPGPAIADCCAPPVGLNPSIDAERLATVAEALSEPVRVHVVDVLRRSLEPVCQCELVALFDAYYSIAPNATQELSSWLT